MENLSFDAGRLLIMALGGLAAALANRGAAVFNDGLRPVMPEFTEGRMDQKALAATSFALCFGLVIGFGIPFSLTSTIVLIHSVLLGTDIIGTWCPRKHWGTALAFLIGAGYGYGLLVGLGTVVEAFKKLPVDFLPSLGQVGAPIVAAFAVFPALAVGYQYGVGKGLSTLALSVVVRQIVAIYGKIPMGDGGTIVLNPEGMSMLAGMIVLLVLAAREKPGAEETVSLVSLFADRVKRIRGNIVLLAVMGGLVAAATSMKLLAGDPISLKLLGENRNIEAALTALARGIGFVPLIVTTAITTGVYGPVGLTFVFVAGLLIANPWLAFVAGLVTIAIEVFFLEFIARALDSFPGIRRCGDNIRTSMSKILEIALIVGGVLAAQAMAPGFGYFVVIGLYVLNQVARRPLVNMAVGPVGAIATGLLLNVLYYLNLFVPPAK
ncbi:MAG: YhfT family protein [Synergistaceae bacterium]|jgi:hypothetical protein|nr:YhfT family protein [Synergistaceae bacterium]